MRLSHEAFPRGFPTGLSHVPPWCVSILGVQVEAVQGKQFSLEWTETWGTLGMVARPWSSSRLSCGERLLLRCDGNTGNSFPNKQGKDTSYRAPRRKWGSSGCGRDPCASFRVEMGMSGNLLSCSKGMKDPLEVPEVRCAFPRDSSVEMGLISPGGETAEVSQVPCQHWRGILRF